MGECLQKTIASRAGAEHARITTFKKVVVGDQGDFRHKAASSSAQMKFKLIAKTSGDALAGWMTFFVLAFGYFQNDPLQSFKVSQ
jgi:hypothetical protein